MDEEEYFKEWADQATSEQEPFSSSKGLRQKDELTVCYVSVGGNEKNEDLIFIFLIYSYLLL